MSETPWPQHRQSPRRPWRAASVPPRQLTPLAFSSQGRRSSHDHDEPRKSQPGEPRADFPAIAGHIPCSPSAVLSCGPPAAAPTTAPRASTWPACLSLKMVQGSEAAGLGSPEKGGSGCLCPAAPPNQPDGTPCPMLKVTGVLGLPLGSASAAGAGVCHLQPLPGVSGHDPHQPGVGFWHNYFWSYPFLFIRFI